MGCRRRLPAGSSPAHPAGCENCDEQSIRRPWQAAALQLRREQGRESRSSPDAQKGRSHNPAPARRHPGRPTAANAAGGGVSPPPLERTILPEGSMWAGRPRSRLTCPTSAILIPWLGVGKFPGGGSAQERSLCLSANGQRLDVRRQARCRVGLPVIAGSSPAGRTNANRCTKSERPANKSQVEISDF